MRPTTARGGAAGAVGVVAMDARGISGHVVLGVVTEAAVDEMEGPPPAVSQA